MNKKVKIGIVAIIIIAIIIGVTVYIVNKVKQEHRQYEVLQIDEYNYFVLYTDGKFGVIDKKGNIIIEPQYTMVKIPNPLEKVFVCYQGDDIQILDETGKELFTEYEAVEPIKLNSTASDLVYEKTVLKYKENGKYGIIDFKGEKITDAIYEELTSFEYREGELKVKQDGKYGVINIRGYELVPCSYDEVEDDKYVDSQNNYQTSGYIVSIKEDDGYKYGYVNYKGKVILKTIYNQIIRVVETGDKDNIYLIVLDNGKYGILKNNKKILENDYQSIEYNDETETFTIGKGSSYGVASLDGNIVIPVENEKIIAKGIYLYTVNGDEQVAYNRDGSKASINSNTTVLKTESDNYFITILSGETRDVYGVIDSSDNQIIPEEYLYIEYAFSNYFIACTQSGKLGVIDDKNNVVVDFDYDIVQKLKGKNIIQTTKATEKITEIYSEKLEKICELENATVSNKTDYVRVYSDSEQYYFDDVGNEIYNVDILDADLYSTIINNSWGFCDKENTIKIECKYDRATEFNQYGFAGILLDGKWGVVNSDGEIIVEPSYEISSSQDPSFVGKYYQVQYGYGEIYYTDGK
jgi:hypothetical protein